MCFRVTNQKQVARNVTDRAPNRCREILFFKILYGKKGNIYGRLKAVGMCTVKPHAMGRTTSRKRL